MEPELCSTDPRTGERGASFPPSSVDDVRRLAVTAHGAFHEGALRDPRARSRLLRTIAARLRGAADELHALCERETALPPQRIRGELERTCGQLEAFAALVEDGSYVRAVIDLPDAAATPPRPDLRRMMVPIGPVAVFGASNFPLAFGVAGGDTASALAAGCPVIAKGHPSQPGTNALIAQELTRAVEDADVPAGAFGHAQSAERDVGEALVDAPEVQAVGFTGSLNGGRALFDRAARRPSPIPVYAEMGSVNPVVVTRRALEARATDIRDAICGAVTFAAGQLCTKPGVVLVPAGPEGDTFVDDAATHLTGQPAGTMLNVQLRDALGESVARLAAVPGVDQLTNGPGAIGPGFRFTPSAFRASAGAVIDRPQLLDEHFGPVVVFVVYDRDEQLLDVVRAFRGELTATVHAEKEDGVLVTILVELLGERVGRLIFNGVPTGVAVTHAMQHGGPYPATTAPATTSVGMAAIDRFLRALAYQDAPDWVLPPALRDDNPLRIWRTVNGTLTDTTVAGASR